MINFKKEVFKHQTVLIDTLQQLLKINTELTSFNPQRNQAPFGIGNQKALEFFLDLGKKENFSVINLDGYAGHIEYGTQKEWVGMIGHLDVVPSGTDWTYPPYAGLIVDDKIYGRGTQDDKGATIAIFWALKILKDLKLPLTKRIKLIVGLDEENQWRCMKHYFQKLPEIPVAGFVPDSHFPAIYCEKGIIDFALEGLVTDPRIIGIESGHANNVVPDFATAVLMFDNSYSKLFDTFIKTQKITATLKAQSTQLIIEVQGISAHGSTPHQGKSALYDLMKILKALGINNNLVVFFNEYLVDSFDGEKMGIAYHDFETQNLICFSGVLKLQQQKACFTLNLRYPNGITFDNIKQQLHQRAKQHNFSCQTVTHHPIMYINPQSDLIQKLVQVYQKYTNDLVSRPFCVGGGTFAKCAPNLVPFGPIFPNQTSLAHQKDEFITIDQLMTLTIIYTEALYVLAK